jgi:hypothetical protein
MITVVGKNGLFLLIKRGRLAQDAEVVPCLTEILKNSGTSDALKFEASAVALLKIQAANGELA